MGSPTGALKTAAKRLGISVDEYLSLVASGQKHCRGCDNWRELEAFAVDRSRGDGRSPVCRSCRITDKPGPSRTERAAMRELGLGWCRRCEEWCAGVRGGLCREHSNEVAREWYAESGWRTRRARPSARRRNVEPITEEIAEILRDGDDGLCAYGCGRVATSWDHVVPVSKDGETVPGNIVPACRPCNSSKSNGDPVPWLAKLRYPWNEKIGYYLTWDSPAMALLD